LGETIDLPTEEVSAQPPVELKPLPIGLCFAFLNSNKNTPVIISDKLSDEETSKLIAILEKHRSIFRYSIQDLKGISPTLCAHRIPIDPSSTPSCEPQHRLNNAMREVVKKSSNFFMLGSFILYHIVTGLVPSKWFLRKEE